MFLMVSQEAGADSGFPGTMQWSQKDPTDQTETPKAGIPIKTLSRKIISSWLGVFYNI